MPSGHRSQEDERPGKETESLEDIKLYSEAMVDSQSLGQICQPENEEAEDKNIETKQNNSARS